jgi:hypothetical protein
MAALAADSQSWRICPGTGEFSIEAGSAGAATYFRGAIATTAVAAATLIKISNAITTDIPFGVVEKKTVATGAASHFIPCWVRGVLWFTGVAAIANATGLALLYVLSASDNPADLTATAAGNSSAFGRIIGIEVTAVSGFVDLTQKALVAETA